MTIEAIYVVAEVEVPGVELGYLSIHKAARAIDRRLAKSGQLVWPFLGHRLDFSTGANGAHIVIRTCLMPLADVESFDLLEQAHIQIAETMSKLPFLANVVAVTASEDESLMKRQAWTPAPHISEKPYLSVVSPLGR